jgi:hypothetical protein
MIINRMKLVHNILGDVIYHHQNLKRNFYKEKKTNVIRDWSVLILVICGVMWAKK